MAKSTKIAVVFPALLAVGALGAWYGLKQVRQSNDDALRVSGNIEATEVGVSFKIAGRVERRLVDEGDVVKRGQLIAELDTSDLEADVALRRAELQAAQASLAEFVAGSRPEEIDASKAAAEKAAALLAELKAGSRHQEIDSAKAQLSAALVEKNRLETELARSRRLFDQKMTSAEEYDRAVAAHNVASDKYRESLEQYNMVKEGPRQEEIDQAKAALAQAQAQYKLVKEGPRKEQIDQARARLKQAEASLSLAETRLGYAKIYSPLSGVVLSKNIEPGEYVAPGTPVVTVADIENIWLRAYVDEMDLDRVKLRQDAEITTDSKAGKTFRGRVGFISAEAEFTPKTVQTEKERVKLVYRIKIDIVNRDMELKPGMPADARIVTAPPEKGIRN
jgi:HlyD family secretion protein